MPRHCDVWRPRERTAAQAKCTHGTCVGHTGAWAQTSGGRARSKMATSSSSPKNGFVSSPRGKDTVNGNVQEPLNKQRETDAFNDNDQ